MWYMRLFRLKTVNYFLKNDLYLPKDKEVRFQPIFNNLYVRVRINYVNLFARHNLFTKQSSLVGRFSGIL